MESANMRTLIVIILDESESMGRNLFHVIGGFNRFVRKQKDITMDTARLIMVTFNTEVKEVYIGIPIKKVPELTADNYKPKEATALYDGIAEAIRITDMEKEKDERVICLIMTDGEENSSRKTTKEEVVDMINSHKAQGDWSFIYIGKDPEKWGRDTKMSMAHCLRFNREDPQQNYLSASDAVSNLRSSELMQSFDLFNNGGNGSGSSGSAGSSGEHPFRADLESKGRFK